VRTIMPASAISAESTPAPTAMRPAVAEQLTALYVTYSGRVESLALSKLRMVDPRVDTELAADVAAEVWLTLSGLAATGGLPGPDRAWAVLRQITIAAVTDAHPCDRRERPAGLAPLHPAAPALARVEQLADAAARPTLLGGAR
jgi:hypothetical protein